jgi:hypothetical protein
VRDYGGQQPPPEADGSSWALAFGTIQAALEKAGLSGGTDKILVAAASDGRAWKPGAENLGAWGVWPGPGDAPTETSSFHVSATVGIVRLQGGYHPLGSSDPNYDLHPTVLSGDLAGDDHLGPEYGGWENIETLVIHENALHVVTIEGNDGITLDGLTIERGNGDDDRSELPDGFEDGVSGGGVLLTGIPVPVPGFPECPEQILSFSQAKFLNCTIQLNTGLSGAGIAATRHWPVEEETAPPVVTIRNSVIRANRTTNRGGGIAIAYGMLDMAGSIVASNRAVDTGGGIFLTGSYPTDAACPMPPGCGAVPGGAFIVHSTIADNETTNSSGAGIAWERLGHGSSVILESTILATNRGEWAQEHDPVWQEDNHQWLSQQGCVGCDEGPPCLEEIELRFCAVPTGQNATTLPNPLTYDVRDPHFLNAGPWISYAEVGPLERTYEVHPCSFARDLGQPDTALLPRDLFDVNHNGVTAGELLPDVVWNDRVQESGYWPTLSSPENPVLRADVGAIEHADPGDCYFDLDQSGAVGSADLAILLGLWTASGSLGGYDGLCLRTVDESGQAWIDPRPCTCIDRNRDGFIGAVELAGLLGAWGPCPTFLQGESETQGLQFEGAEPASMSPFALAGMFGFSSLEEFAIWLGQLPEPARALILANLGGAA